MNILCYLFGHRPAFGYGRAEGQGYFRVKLGVIDGVGTRHASLHCDCERCDKNYQVGMIHIPMLAHGVGPFTKAVEKIIAHTDTHLERRK